MYLTISLTRPFRLFTAALCAAVCLLSNPVLAQSDAGALDAVTHRFFSESEMPGLSVSVAEGGTLIFSRGYGYADLEQHVRVLPGESRFRIGSVSKTMTALAVGKLVQAGKLDLDAPVQRYVPSFPEKKWPITTRMVAGHVAGVRHYSGDEFLSQRRYESVLEGLTIFENDTLVFEPGTRYSYSSYGWNLVSAVVEGASGIDFLTYMQDSVFVPAGMIRTVADHTGEIVEYRTRFYERNALGQIVPAPYVDNSYKWAGGGFLSTTEDLIRFGQAHLDGILDEATIEILWTPQNLIDGSSTNYAIGWSSGTDNNGRFWVGHNGGSVGGTTRFRIYPQQEIIVAAVTNLSTASFGSLVEDLVEALSRQ
ncbi:MAG: beta-lactamase family protein [Rhodothermales bacterium]|nr:beta-lactamase family protein [Rhodothermales bacterium]